MRTLLSKLWFWLTYHSDCGWCGCRIRSAWIPLKSWQCDGVKLPRISHGICKECFSQMETVAIKHKEAA